MRVVLYIYTVSLYLFLFFFNDPATTEIYTLSLHDALPISARAWRPRSPCSSWCSSSSATWRPRRGARDLSLRRRGGHWLRDRKSTRLNSSHGYISYAVFCLKKKKKKDETRLS